MSYFSESEKERIQNEINITLESIAANSALISTLKSEDVALLADGNDAVNTEQIQNLEAKNVELNARVENLRKELLALEIAPSEEDVKEDNPYYPYNLFQDDEDEDEDDDDDDSDVDEEDAYEDEIEDDFDKQIEDELENNEDIIELKKLLAEKEHRLEQLTNKKKSKGYLSSIEEAELKELKKDIKRIKKDIHRIEKFYTRFSKKDKKQKEKEQEKEEKQKNKEDKKKEREAKKKETKEKLSLKDIELSDSLKRNLKIAGSVIGISAVILITMGITKACDGKKKQEDESLNVPDDSYEYVNTDIPNAEMVNNSAKEQLKNIGYSDFIADQILYNTSDEMLNVIIGAGEPVDGILNYLDATGFDITKYFQYEEARTTLNITGKDAVDLINRANILKLAGYYDKESITYIAGLLKEIGDTTIIDSNNYDANAIASEINPIVEHLFGGTYSDVDRAKISCLHNFAKAGSDLAEFLTGLENLVLIQCDDLSNAENNQKAYDYIDAYAHNVNGFNNVSNDEEATIENHRDHIVAGYFLDGVIVIFQVNQTPERQDAFVNLQKDYTDYWYEIAKSDCLTLTK